MPASAQCATWLVTIPSRPDDHSRPAVPPIMWGSPLRVSASSLPNMCRQASLVYLTQARGEPGGGEGEPRHRGRRAAEQRELQRAVGALAPPDVAEGARFLCSSVMLHLGQLSYGIYVCQLGALYTVMWLHNGFTLPGPATWLNHPVAAYGIWALDIWQLAEVFVLLLSVVQLAEVAFARLGVGGTSRAK